VEELKRAMQGERTDFSKFETLTQAKVLKLEIHTRIHEIVGDRDKGKEYVRVLAKFLQTLGGDERVARDVRGWILEVMGWMNDVVFALNLVLRIPGISEWGISIFQPTPRGPEYLNALGILFSPVVEKISSNAAREFARDAIIKETANEWYISFHL
jgi:hypothetical protein